ncbi:MAG: hypothetical protein HQ542_01185 [Bacteroidia bacterium]|nr:hypothetical protein [Bacteroidia bacterium]
MRLIKKLLLLIIFLLFVLPFIQSHFLFMEEQELDGFFKLAPPPSLKDFTWEGWFSGTFQEVMNTDTKDHIGFRNTFFRLHNEYDYRLFGITHAQGFIQGKEGYLFEEDYIHEYTGRYFIGKETLDYKLEKLQQVYWELGNAGIPFLLVFEPGKASFFPEYIPDHFHPENKTISNYDYMTKRVNELKIPSMDLNQIFMQMKETSEYPLFPKFGMHWSIYGAALAMDTLSQYLERVYKVDLPEMDFADIVVSDSLRWTDKDIGELLNLIFPYSTETMAYPIITYDSTKEKQLSVLVIADSYYVNIIHDISGHLFKDQEYWYYNSKLYPHIIDDRNPVYVDKSNLKEKLLEFDLILLMVSEINLHCGFWNFADEACQAFFPDHQDPPWYPYENNIRNSREWFRYMVSKSRERGLSLEDAIIEDAKYMYHTKNH